MKPFHQGLVKQLVMAGFAKPCAEQYLSYDILKVVYRTICM